MQRKNLFQDCHSNLRSQIPDIPDIILSFWTKNSWHFQCRLERGRTNFKKHKTNMLLPNCWRTKRESYMCLWLNWGVKINEPLLNFHFYLFTHFLALQSIFKSINTCLILSCYNKFLQSIKVNLSLFNTPWPRSFFKYLIIIEIARKKFTLNIKFHSKFYLEIKWS